MASKRPTKMWQAERRFKTGEKESQKKKTDGKMVKKIQRIKMIAREWKKIGRKRLVYYGI